MKHRVHNSTSDYYTERIQKTECKPCPLQRSLGRPEPDLASCHADLGHVVDSNWVGSTVGQLSDAYETYSTDDSSKSTHTLCINFHSSTEQFTLNTVNYGTQAFV